MTDPTVGKHGSHYYAHTTEGPVETWEPLLQHLRQVAVGEGKMPGAKQFAEAFGAGDWAEAAGWWHDLGKYSAAFQRRLFAGADPDQLERQERVDHSTAGAKHAITKGLAGYLVAYAIAGHHGGMPDIDGPGRSTLRYRLNEKQLDDFSAAPSEILRHPLPQAVGIDHADNPQAFSVAFRMRMLFSCLVDADRLWTEHFYDPEKASARKQTNPVKLSELREQLKKKTDSFIPDSYVKEVRAEILADCIGGSADRPGFFSMHVPTGGGKTLSSLAFALNHAAKHDLQRVVYAIPLTSIVEQTAQTFADIFGDSAVLEHHSGLSEAQLDNQTITQRLATENFDAPLIVTTSVQVLETLFANTPSKCRKLHRFANSVIIFDEVQTLPADLLRPTLAALKELVVNHGCTIVLCSATQPAVQYRDDFDVGLKNIRPLVDDPTDLHHRLKRTKVELVGERDIEHLAGELDSCEQVLSIVNSRRHARDLTEAVDGDCIHLSANLCGQHRSDNVNEIKQRLKDEATCRVVATTVIEAGVDVDFPIVYRAIAGADSIAQAAGRCNREGSRDSGPVRVFDYDRRAYPGVDQVRDGIQALEQILPEHRDDILAPAAISAYFEQLYFKRRGEDGPNRGWDRRSSGGRSIMECFAGDRPEDCFDHFFRTAASTYRLIPDGQISILVPYKNGEELISELRNKDESDVTTDWLRNFNRRTQRFTVSVYEQTFRLLMENTTVAERFGRFYLTNQNAYDDRFGIDTGVVGMGAEQSVC